MSIKKGPVYKKGCTGFVELEKTVAKKYSKFNSTFWINEYSILLYLWPFETRNIIKYQRVALVKRKDPDGRYGIFYETIFDRYPFTLSKFKVYHDKTLLQIMLDISSALKFMHSMKIWHRDVKPQNILIDEHGRATIIDFTHSHRFVIDISELNTHVVTSYYRAPEVFRYAIYQRDAYTEKIDVWSLGIILVEIITGRIFIGEVTDACDESIRKIVSDPELFHKHLKAFYMDNKRLFKYADEYWQLILKMTNHLACDRPSMEEVYNELLNIANDNKVSVNIPVNHNKRGMEWRRNAINYSNVPEEIINLCKVKFTDWRKLLRINLNFTQIIDVLKFLYKKEILTVDSYSYCLMAVVLILETVLYDGISEINKVADAVRLECDKVRDCIMMLVENFDQELFVNDTFKFREFKAL
jgi:serine/threonine protein kinase